jgi:hypothetical protein
VAVAVVVFDVFCINSSVVVAVAVAVADAVEVCSSSTKLLEFLNAGPNLGRNYFP